MEFRHLRYFAALADRLNFTRAADAVHVAQSTLSHQIKQFEDELGFPLFQRTGKRVLLTAAGAALLPKVECALRDIDDVIRTFRASARDIEGEVRMGVAAHVFNDAFIPECLSNFLAENPLVRTTVVNLTATGMAPEKVRSGDVEFAVSDIPMPSDGFRFDPLYDEELAFVAGDAHPFALRKHIRTIELHRAALALPTPDIWTRTVIDRCFAAAGAIPNVVAEIGKISTIFELVKTSAVGTILSRNSASEIEGLHAISLEDPTPKRTIGLLWLEASEPSEPARRLAQIIRHTVDISTRHRGTWPQIEPYAPARALDRPLLPVSSVAI